MKNAFLAAVLTIAIIMISAIPSTAFEVKGNEKPITVEMLAKDKQESISLSKALELIVSAGDNLEGAAFAPTKELHMGEMDTFGQKLNAAQTLLDTSK